MMAVPKTASSQVAVTPIPNFLIYFFIHKKINMDPFTQYACFASNKPLEKKIDTLQKQIDTLQEQVDALTKQLDNMLIYSPNNPGYQTAKSDFETRKK